jgi:hypothetical protein
MESEEICRCLDRPVFDETPAICAAIDKQKQLKLGEGGSDSGAI